MKDKTEAELIQLELEVVYIFIGLMCAIGTGMLIGGVIAVLMNLP